MSLFSVVGDPHAVPGNLEEIGLLFDILEDIGNDVILLGDLFDTKEIIRGRVFNYVYKRLSKSKLDFIILVGNHDWFNLDCQEHSLETLKKLQNVTIVDKPYLEKDILFVPYFNDLAQFKKALEGYSEANVLFMHQGVTGFDYGNGHVADGNGHGELPQEATSGFKKVISGHFHKFAEDGNLTFLGTPFSHSFGETDQTKYIGIFDSKTLELELLETPFPRHRTISVELTDDKNKNIDAILQYTKGKDLWRVKLVGTEMQIKTIDQEAISKVKFLEEPTDAEQAQDAAIDDTDSNEQKFLTWATQIKGLDEETIKLGLEIMGEAR